MLNRMEQGFQQSLLLINLAENIMKTRNANNRKLRDLQTCSCKELINYKYQNNCLHGAPRFNKLYK